MFSIRSTPRPQRLLPALAAGWALLTPAELPAEPAPSNPPGGNPHWPIAPEVAEEALAQCQLQILSKRYAGRGLTGAYRAEARLPDTGMRFPVKWKSMPGDLDGVNNSPRKELASYQVQRLFLDPEDFVVPTSVARCLPPEAFPDPEEHDRATDVGTTKSSGSRKRRWT